MLQFCNLLAPKGLRLAKNAGKQNTSWKLLYKNALEYHTWILAPSHHKQNMWAYWHWNKNIRGRNQGSRWLTGLIMGYVLFLIFWLRFSPGGKWQKMAALLWPLGLDVSTWVLVNKDPPPSNKNPKKRNLEQMSNRCAKNSMGRKKKKRKKEK